MTTLGWAATIGVIVLLLALEFLVSGRRPRAIGFREAVGWSVFYIAVAVAFGVVFGLVAGWHFGTLYFAGYIVEKSLSVDNLFVFVIIMTTFAVPVEHQKKALTMGIVTALVLRAIFIALGAALLSAFSVMFLLFGLLLLGTAVQLFRHRDQDPSVEDNAVLNAARRMLPFTNSYDEHGRFVTRVGDRRMLTPLFLVLLAIGSTDVVFALDSIPAVFGITTDRFIVFTSNLFAVLGLRSLFFALSGLLDKLRFLKHGLVGVLGLVGTKMMVAAWWPAPAWLSLVLVTLILGSAIVASLMFPVSTPNPDRIPNAERS